MLLLLNPCGVSVTPLPPPPPALYTCPPPHSSIIRSCTTPTHLVDAHPELDAPKRGPAPALVVRLMPVVAAAPPAARPLRLLLQQPPPRAAREAELRRQLHATCCVGLPRGNIQFRPGHMWSKSQHHRQGFE